MIPVHSIVLYHVCVNCFHMRYSPILLFQQPTILIQHDDYLLLGTVVPNACRNAGNEIQIANFFLGENPQTPRFIVSAPLLKPKFHPCSHTRALVQLMRSALEPKDARLVHSAFLQRALHTDSSQVTLQLARILNASRLLPSRN